jgi:hypothetical protein
MKACDYCIFIFYFLLNFFTITSLCTFGKDLFTRFSPLFLIILFTSAIFSYYLLLTIRSDPGIVKSNDYTNLESTIIENTNLSQNNNLRDLELISVPINPSLTNENKLINEEESKLEESMHSKCEKCVIDIVNNLNFKLITD